MAQLIQIIGISYILLMLYLTFLYYKKNNYSMQSFIFWVVVWAAGGVLLAFPNSASLLTQQLHVARVTDFYLILGLMFFSVITFLNSTSTKRTEKRVEELVRKIAIKKK